MNVVPTPRVRRLAELMLTEIEQSDTSGADIVLRYARKIRKNETPALLGLLIDAAKQPSPEPTKLEPVVARECWESAMFAAVTGYFEVNEADIIHNRSRDAFIVDARHIAMWLMRDAGYSLVRTGERFRRDHTTILHGARRVQQRADLLAIAEQIKSALAEEAA